MFRKNIHISKNPISRTEWEKKPFESLVKAFKEKMKNYKGGDVVIEVPRTYKEVVNHEACRPALTPWRLAAELCEGAVWYEGVGVITFPEKAMKNFPFNSVEHFQKVILANEAAAKEAEDAPLAESIRLRP